MLLHRGFRYRIYPSAAQVERLHQWEGACRTLWNCAHQQREMGLARTDGKIFPTAASQMRELTDLRAQLPWMDDVPCDVAQATLKALDAAWSRFFAKQAGRPQFKVKGRDTLGLTEAHAKAWRIETKHGRDVLIFPKLGYLPIELHRCWEGKRSSATISREGDAWFVSIHTEREVPEPASPHGPVIALDLGVAVAVADSEGGMVANPRFGEQAQPRLAKRQRQLSKKKKGSKNRAKAREAVARCQRKLRRQREHFAHCVTKYYAKNHRVIVLEDLRVKNMTASAKGTAEEPGTHVAAKAGLNRALLDVAPYRFRTLRTQKAQRYGSQVVLQPPAYSSQECSECGFVCAENRRHRDWFRCLYCGYEGHADTNAAKVLKKRYTRRTGGEEVCGGDSVGRPGKQKLRSVRTKTPKSNAGAKSTVVHDDGDGLPMASIPLPRSERFSTPDVDRAVHQIERERKLKVAGVFSGLVLLVAGLLGVAYLNFGQTYDGGPPRVEPTPVAHPGEVGP